MNDMYISDGDRGRKSIIFKAEHAQGESKWIYKNSVVIISVPISLNGTLHQFKGIKMYEYTSDDDAIYCYLEALI
jgi:hypothetical protein